MKRILAFFTAALLLASLAACGNASQTETKETPAATQAATQAAAVGQKESAESTKAAESGSASSEAAADTETSSETVSDETNSADESTASQPDVLVAYFSATGTTKGVAEKIAAITGGDLYEIVPAEPYSDADLNWNDRNNRSTKEQDDKSVRPGIGSAEISLESYTTVYLGFPIWWGEEPRIMDTFVEKYSFSGITVIPFCTSASSGIGRSGPNMEALAGSGTWLDGRRFSGSVSEADLQVWIEGLK